MYYLFFEKHSKCLKNVNLIPGLSAGEHDPLPLNALSLKHKTPAKGKGEKTARSAKKYLVKESILKHTP